MITGSSPSQLFLSRTLRTRFDLVRPEEVFTKVTQKWNAQTVPAFRSFKPTQMVYFLSGNIRMDKWIKGTITARLGQLHYEIDYGGKRFKRHVDQIRAYQEDQTTKPTDGPVSSTDEDVTYASPRRVRFYPDNSATLEGHPPQGIRKRLLLRHCTKEFQIQLRRQSNLRLRGLRLERLRRWGIAPLRIEPVHPRYTHEDQHATVVPRTDSLQAASRVNFNQGS